MDSECFVSDPTPDPDPTFKEISAPDPDPVSGFALRGLRGKLALFREITTIYKVFLGCKPMLFVT